MGESIPVKLDRAADESELLSRARGLAGESVATLAIRLGVALEGEAVRTKGKVGTLIERALGADGGCAATWDFSALRVELKTIPVDSRGQPRESTFVCAASLIDAERAEWATSWARAKLSRVLWVPIVGDSKGGERRVGDAILWSPSAAQERQFADDFDDIFGRIGFGDIEAMSGHVGRFLQLRPKGAHGRVRTLSPGAEGTLVAAMPRGLYLRARFTGAILRDPMAFPDDAR